MIISERIKSLILAGEATERDLSGIDPAEVRALKADGNAEQMRIKAADSSVDVEARRAKFVWTDESVDGDGDKFMVDGWKLKRFSMNPVILLSHDRKELPIGVATSVKIDREQRRGLVEVQFAEKGTNPRADIAFEMVRQGILKATSAGFRVLKIAQLTDEQAKDEGLGKYGIKGLEQELHEISLVTVPSNVNALQCALKGLVESGTVRDQDARAFEKDLRPTERDIESRRKEAEQSYSQAATEFLTAHTKLVDAITKNTETTRALLQHVSDLTKSYARARGPEPESDVPAPESKTKQYTPAAFTSAVRGKA